MWLFTEGPQQRRDQDSLSRARAWRVAALRVGLGRGGWVAGREGGVPLRARVIALTWQERSVAQLTRAAKLGLCTTPGRGAWGDIPSQRRWGHMSSLSRSPAHRSGSGRPSPGGSLYARPTQTSSSLGSHTLEGGSWAGGWGPHRASGVAGANVWQSEA